MDNEQFIELLKALNRIADQLEELNNNVQYLPVWNGLTVSEVRTNYEKYDCKASYYDD